MDEDQSPQMKKALAYLDAHGITYNLKRHPAVFTSAEADKHREGFVGVACKNLFLRNKKGTRYMLVSLPTTMAFDLEKFARSIGEKHLSFASPERLLKVLGVTPGSVTPLALINDTENEANFFIHQDVLDAEQVSIHPNDNTGSLWLSHDVFAQLLSTFNRNVTVINDVS